MVDCQRALAHSRGQRVCGYTAGLRLLGRHLGPRCTFRLRLQLAEATWQMSQCLGDSVSAQSHTIQILQIWRTWQMSHEQCLGDSVAAQIHTIQIVQIWRTWQMSQCLGDSVAAQIHTIQRQHVGPEGRAASLPHACSCSRVMVASSLASCGSSGSGCHSIVASTSWGTDDFRGCKWCRRDRDCENPIEKDRRQRPKLRSARTGTTCATHAQVLSASRNQNSFSQGARRTRRSA